jgi:Putative zinc dependent peptidase (DUF5700)
MFLPQALSLLLMLHPGAGAPSPRVQVKVVSDEADAVLAILAKREAAAEISDADWQRLFESEGYRRLKKREISMQRPFEDADFKTFVLSPELLARTSALRQTLEKWKRADMNTPGRLALAYLPEDAYIHATIYPEIKPRTNSFVFDAKTDPAIFLYLDPEISREKFENTVAHELHHIGYSTACPSAARQALIAQQSAPVRELAQWTGAFGEGFAMLAAAGGPDVHPHAVSKAEDRQRWDRDVADFKKSQQELDLFFRKILSGELNDDQINKQAFSYFGEQGPWYTVGWKMAVTIEKAYGRPRLIEVMCNTPALFSTYNAAAVQLSAAGGQKPPLWSPEIVRALEPLAQPVSNQKGQRLQPSSGCSPAQRRNAAAPTGT